MGIGAEFYSNVHGKGLTAIPTTVWILLAVTVPYTTKNVLRTSE